MNHTYCITNAAVGQTPEKYRFVENKYQLAINARTPVEEIQIDGLTLRTMTYNFTPITAISQVHIIRKFKADQFNGQPHVPCTWHGT
ncbi:hypothetical protein RHMOL_Rhmol03G0129200 [Rhododendron molle]|uniref:Uncharacterized protein n=1 Tax=Rhododendron molle TaxID=49168 RepID=A0ACC0PDQ7_RHOML|nr:hypothetical protein RHMOL_Rhmol03G0129200 [Rhododendron molle]